MIHEASMTLASQTTMPFWSWSLSVYLKPVVADQCLDLQDTEDADVNLVLWCAWIPARYGTALSSADIEAGRALVAPLAGTVTRPLRAVRRAVKALPCLAGEEARRALRAKILEAELDAERIEQTALDALACERLGPDLRPLPLDAVKRLARENIAAYLSAIGARADEPSLGQKIVSLVNAIF